MENLAQKNSAMDFAVAFAEALGTVLNDATGEQWPLEVVRTGNIPANDAQPIQFRMTVEGALHGECFIEFYEPQVASLLSRMSNRPIRGLAEEHKAHFAKLIASIASALPASLLSAHGQLAFRIERVSGLAFGGMFVVPIESRQTEPELEVLLYFGGQLLEALSAAPAGNVDSQSEANKVSPYNLKLVMDVELNVSLRFGQRQLPLREVLDLASGSIIELDRMVDEPVELYLDGKLIARGEAVVVDGNYGLRVTEIPEPIAPHLLN